MRALLLVALCAACRIPDEQFPGVDAAADSATDGAPGTGCNSTKPFNAPVEITELESSLLSEMAPRLSHDELVIYYWVRSSGSLAGGDLVSATRSMPTGTFGAPQNLTIDDSSVQRDPTVTGDNLKLYYSSDAATPGTNKIYLATRATTGVDFSNPAPVTDLDLGTAYDEIDPYVEPNDQDLYLAIEPPGATMYELYAARRATGGGAYMPPYLAPFSRINDPAAEQRMPVVSVDLLTVYFESNRSGGLGGPDIYKATRGAANMLFDNPVNVTEVNTSDSEYPGWISDDGCRLYFERGPVNGHDWQLWVASKPPM
jgi:hypothetical protein